MSWAEVIKINSDFLNEPLNFNNYINDISIFGADSYVMDKENEFLWKQLITESLTLFGHDAIHNYVLNRFTDVDIDYMIRNNTRLGQSMNSFYKTAIFKAGNIDNLLSTISAVKYNTLDLKFQRGLNRYIDEQIKKNTVGEWLNSIFNTSLFDGYTSIQDILKNTDLWNNSIIKNESMRIVIANAASAIAFVANTDTTIFKSFVSVVATSTTATHDLLEMVGGTGKLTTFFADADICTTLTANANSMTAIIYNTAGLAAMLASSTAMAKVAASTTAINVIITGMTNCCNTETVLNTIKTNLNNIVNSLPKIVNSSDLVNQVNTTKSTIDATVNAVKASNVQSDILINSVSTIVNSTTAMQAIAANNTAITKIASNASAMSKLAASSTAMTAIAASSTAITAIAASSTAMTTVCKNTNFMNKIIASNVAMKAIAASTVALQKIYTTSGSVVISDPTAFMTALNKQTVTVSFLNSSIANTWYNLATTALSGAMIWSNSAIAVQWFVANSITTMYGFMQKLKAQSRHRYWYMKNKSYRHTALQTKIASLLTSTGYTTYNVSSYLFLRNNNNSVNVALYGNTNTGTAMSFGTLGQVNALNLQSSLNGKSFDIANINETNIGYMNNRPFIFDTRYNNSANGTYRLQGYDVKYPCNVLTYNPFTKKIECVDSFAYSDTTTNFYFYANRCFIMDMSVITNASYYNNNYLYGYYNNVAL